MASLRLLQPFHQRPADLLAAFTHHLLSLAAMAVEGAASCGESAHPHGGAGRRRGKAVLKWVTARRPVENALRRCATSVSFPISSHTISNASPLSFINLSSNNPASQYIVTRKSDTKITTGNHGFLLNGYRHRMMWNGY